MEQAESQSRSPRDNQQRRRNLSHLAHSTYDSKRLASARRVLGALLVITGAPVMALSRAADPTIRRTITILAAVWLTMALALVRLLWMEWRNNRLTEYLRALVQTDDDRS